MKAQSKILNILSLLLFLFFAFGCSSEESDELPNPDSETPSDPDPDPEEESLTYEEVFAIGNDIFFFDEERVESIISQEETTSDEDNGNGTVSRFICTTETVDLADGTGKFNLFDANAEVVFPGNLLQGKTISEATPSPIVVERAGGTISIDLNTGTSLPAVTVDEVKRSTIQTAINEIISASGEEAPANFTLDIEQVESEEHLAVELGISVRAFRVNVSSNFSFSSEKEFNRTLVKLDQKMYNIGFDLPTDIGQIFAESVTPEDLEPFVQPDNPATFISSVTFGRVFYMLIESTSTREEMNASINASFSGLAVNASAGLEVESLESLKDLKIKVIAYGGPASTSFELIGETNIQDIASTLGQSSDLRFALPISYVVRSVERPDQIVGSQLSTQFDRTTCELKGQLPIFAYRGLVDIFGEDDTIGAAFNIQGAIIGVYNKEGNRYAIYDAKLGITLAIFDHNDPNGPLGVSDLENVGAGFKFTEKSKGFDATKVILTDNGGKVSQPFVINENFTISESNPIGTYETTSLIGDILGIDLINGQPTKYDLSAESISAAAGLPFSMADNNRMTSLVFSGESSRFVQNLFSSSNRRSNVDAQDLTELNTPGDPDGKVFNKIEAAAIVRFGGEVEELLLINEQGDLMMYLQDLDATKRGVYREIKDGSFTATYSGLRVLQ